MKGQQASLEALQTAAADAGETEVLDAWLTEHSIQHCGAVFERLSVQEGWAATVEQVLGKRVDRSCASMIVINFALPSRLLRRLRGPVW